MYTDYYKLTDWPFRLTPDHRFFFGSRSHRRAMAYFEYGLTKGEGFIVVTGKVGTGKTTLVHQLLAGLQSDKYIVANVCMAHLNADDLLHMIAPNFDVRCENIDKATVLRQLESNLIARREADKHILLVVDEAQNLPERSIEELRMLSNLQHREKALLQIYLVGQPQFRATLLSDRLEPLRERVIASHHLEPMDAAETRAYIEHRLNHAGWRNDPSFTEQVFDVIYAQTDGIPRKINLLCDRVLLCGCLEDQHQITQQLVEEVIWEQRMEMSRGAIQQQEPTAQQAEPQKPDLALSSDELKELLMLARRHLSEQERHRSRVGYADMSWLDLQPEQESQIEAWRHRPIEGTHPYLYLDSAVLIRNRSGEVNKVSLLVAIAVNDDGYRDILGICEGAKENTTDWTAFLAHLAQRGLKGVRLVTSNAFPWLVECVGEFFPEARCQRSIVHWYEDVRSLVPTPMSQQVALMLKAIHAQESGVAAEKKAQEVVARLQGLQLNEAAEWVGKCLTDTLAYYSFPPQHWPRIRTINMLNRMLREITRNTQITDSFPSRASAVNLAVACLRQTADFRWSGRRYLDMKALQETDSARVSPLDRYQAAIP